MAQETNINQKCIDAVRILSAEAITKANSGHPGICFGAAPAAFTLFSDFLKFSCKNPKWENRDRFILSAGHGSMLLYSLLHLFNFNVTKEDLKNFRQFGSKTPGHPEYGVTDGVDCSTGPLGQGIANAVGIALAEAYLGAKFNRADFKDILAHESRVLEIIKNDLLEVKRKFPSARRTEISTEFTGDIEDADLIPVEQVVVSMTHSGYAKRLPVAEYRAQHRGGKGITGHKPKEEDFVERMFVCSSHDDLLLFSTLGKVYRIKAFEIPEAARTARGRAMVNLVQIAQDEKITTIIPVKEKEGYIAFATKNGMIKKTRLEEFERINRNGKIAIKLNEGDELISVQFTTGENELMIASRTGKCIRFSESNVRSMGRDTAGVRAMKLEGETDALVDMLVVDESKDLLSVTANGCGKRSRLEDYRVQGRAGKGIKAGTFNEVTGDLVNLKQVTEEDDVMLISDGGTIIRMHCDAISKFGRASRGVRLMRLKDGAVATVAITERDDEAEAAAPEETAADVPDEPAETGEISEE